MVASLDLWQNGFSSSRIAEKSIGASATSSKLFESCGEFLNLLGGLVASTLCEEARILLRATVMASIKLDQVQCSVPVFGVSPRPQHEQVFIYHEMTWFWSPSNSLKRRGVKSGLVDAPKSWPRLDVHIVPSFEIFINGCKQPHIFSK
jgi:hypothetical protein